MESSPSGSGLSHPLKPFFLKVCDSKKEMKLVTLVTWNQGFASNPYASPLILALIIDVILEEV